MTIAASGEFDFAVVGGGLVGSCIAYGLSKTSNSVCVLDEGDRAFRAARGNFGLVWVQGKGWDYPAYARWTRIASDLWPGFSDQLQSETGVALGYRRPGGLEFCLTDQELVGLGEQLAKLQFDTGGEFEYEMLDPATLRELVPEVSDEVRGASFCPHDGDVNPLFLLRALHQVMDDNAAQYIPNSGVDEIRSLSGGGFELRCAKRTVQANRVVLCAGLDNQRLSAMVDINLPVQANRGQLLITERVQPFLPYPTLHVRQTDNGGLQIGDSAEDVGLDDATSTDIMTMLANRAGRIFPRLRSLQVVRAWAALRILTPDGKPVYQASASCPGAFAVACHSGVTLAPAHAGPLVDWLAGQGAGADCDELISKFSSARFDV